MIHIRKALQTYLKTKHARLYFQHAPEKATFPYLVFDITNAVILGVCQDNYFIDIDGWDLSEDTTALETLMETIRGNDSLSNPSGLNKRTLTESGTAITFHLENIMSISDDDPKIKRRKHIYQARQIKG